MRTILLALVLLAPLAAAGPADVALHAFALGGSMLVDVTYSDGVGSTRFGFLQHAGDTGGPQERLEPGATCTEWVGTFTQILIKATSADHVRTARAALVGAHASTGPTTRDTGGFTFDAQGGPGALDGSLLVCDQPGGTGRVRATLDVARTPLVRADPVLVRMTEG